MKLDEDSSDTGKVTVRGIANTMQSELLKKGGKHLAKKNL